MAVFRTPVASKSSQAVLADRSCKFSVYPRSEESAAMKSPRFSRVILTAVVFSQLLILSGCEELLHNTQSLLLPNFQRSDVFGFIAGLGTTFAVLPDLIVMFRRRSSSGMNPRMAAIIGCFQVLWVYYGILIISRPVVIWNVIGVLINFTTVFAYRYFVKKERLASGLPSESA
jgi:uncharacterized protein with PQ loop repeat